MNALVSSAKKTWRRRSRGGLETPGYDTAKGPATVAMGAT